MPTIIMWFFKALARYDNCWYLLIAVAHPESILKFLLNVLFASAIVFHVCQKKVIGIMKIELSIVWFDRVYLKHYSTQYDEIPPTTTYVNRWTWNCPIYYNIKQWLTPACLSLYKWLSCSKKRRVSVLDALDGTLFSLRTVCAKILKTMK